MDKRNPFPGVWSDVQTLVERVEAFAKTQFASFQPTDTEIQTRQERIFAPEYGSWLIFRRHANAQVHGYYLENHEMHNVTVEIYVDPDGNIVLRDTKYSF